MLAKKQTIILSICTILTIISFSCLKETSGLKQSDVEPLISQILKHHVQYKSLNDEIAKKAFNNLIRSLDPGKSYFYKKDIQKLSIYNDKIDDLIMKNDFKFISEIFTLYKKRFQEAMNLFSTLIENEFDFNRDESIIIDPDKLKFPDNISIMKERWRKNIKLQLLNYLPTVHSIEKAKAKLKKRYQLNSKRINEMDNRKKLTIIINSFSTALDPHTNYLAQEEHEDFMINAKLKFEGIGARLRSEDGFAIIESLIPGGAASKLAPQYVLKPNDKIIAVSQGEQEATDIIDMKLRDVVKLIRGKKGTEVRLTIIRQDPETQKQQRLIIPIIREKIKLEDSAAKSDLKIINNFKIGYLKLPSFYLDFETYSKSSSRDVKKLLKRLNKEKVNGIIIDLRGNLGGMLSEAVELTGHFIDQGPVVQIKDFRSKIKVEKDKNPGLVYNGPIVVLIDKFSASASEIFAGAIKDYKRGLVIGSSNSFGKGTVQNYSPLPQKKGAIKITTAIFYQPAGTSNQLHGIKPHMIVPDLSSIWDIGENKLPNPLQWKAIKKADYRPYKIYINQFIITRLKRLSNERMSASEKFTKLMAKIKKFKTRLKNKTISLKEETKTEQKQLTDLQKNIRKSKESKIIDFETDLFLKEAFAITADYIKTLN